MTTINQILTEDKPHHLMNCPRVKGRRLYIRDCMFKLNFDYPKLKLDSKPIPKQRFRPIGLICISCGHVMVSDKVLYTKKKINDVISKTNLLADSATDSNRAERRRLSRLEKRKKISYDKLGIKEPKEITFEDSY